MANKYHDEKGHWTNKENNHGKCYHGSNNPDKLLKNGFDKNKSFFLSKSKYDAKGYAGEDGKIFETNIDNLDIKKIKNVDDIEKESMIAKLEGFDGIKIINDNRITNFEIFNTDKLKIKEVNEFENKLKQLDIILKNNPMKDDYHVGIRKVEDIKTWEEAMKDKESFFYGDFSEDDAYEALRTGRIKIYSSKPFEQGSFVSTSKNMAQDYAGSGKIYEKEIDIDDVAWINGDEGQLAII